MNDRAFPAASAIRPAESPVLRATRTRRCRFASSSAHSATPAVSFQYPEPHVTGGSGRAPCPRHRRHPNSLPLLTGARQQTGRPRTDAGCARTISVGVRIEEVRRRGRSAPAGHRRVSRRAAPRATASATNEVAAYASAVPEARGRCRAHPTRAARATRSRRLPKHRARRRASSRCWRNTRRRPGYTQSSLSRGPMEAVLGAPTNHNRPQVVQGVSFHCRSISC